MATIEANTIFVHDYLQTFWCSKSFKNWLFYIMYIGSIFMDMSLDPAHYLVISNPQWY